MRPNPTTTQSNYRVPVLVMFENLVKSYEHFSEYQGSMTSQILNLTDQHKVLKTVSFQTYVIQPIYENLIAPNYIFNLNKIDEIGCIHA